MATYVSPTFIGASTGSNSGAPSNTVTAPVPTGSLPGDMMIAYANAVGTGSPAFATPAGWNLELFQVRSSGQTGTYVFSKRVEVGESAPVFTSGVSHAGHTLSIVTFRNVGTVGDNSGATSGTTNPVTMVAVNPQFDNSVVLYSNSNVTSAALPNPTVTWSAAATEVTDVQADYTVSGVNARSGQSVAYANQATAGTSAAVTATMSSVTGGTSARTSLVLRPVVLQPIYKDFSEATASTSGSASLTVTYPAGSVSGDLLVMSIMATRTSAAATITSVPTGWTLVPNTFVDQSANFISGAMVYRVRGAETSVTIDTSATTVSNAIIHAYDPGNIDLTSPIGASGGTIDLTASQTSMSVPINNTSANGTISMFAHSRRASGTTAYTNTWTGATEKSDTAQASSSGTALSRTSAVRYEDAPSNITDIVVTPSVAVSRSYASFVVLQPVQNLTIIDSDAATGTDDAKVVAAVPNTDTGTSTEDASLTVADPVADTGTGADNANVVATSTDSDSGTGTDNATVYAVITDTDTATFTDDAFVSNTVVDTDTAQLTDNDATISGSNQDASTAADDAYVTAQIFEQEVGSIGEDLVITVWADYETFAGSDNAAIGLPAADASGVTADNATVSAAVPTTDTVFYTENASIIVWAEPDGGEADDNAVRSVEGILVAPRVYTIYPDERTYSVESEDRTYTIARVYREVVFSYEGFIDSN